MIQDRLPARVLRRGLSRLCFAAAAVMLLASSPAGAAGPQLKTSAPGWYRMMLGDFEVTALNDGTVDLHVLQLLTHTTAARIQRALARAYLKDPIETSVNGYLVNTGSKLVLIDTGAGAFFGPTLGKLLANLKASGYQPEQVDEIYLTHMHADHLGGLVANGQIVFPNAVVRADRHDADFWLDPKTLEAAPADEKDFVKAAQTALKPYIDAGRFKPFDADAALAPGIKAIAARGHTPGHTIYAIESRGEKLFAWGDLMHVAAVQFPDPGVTIKFDTDSMAAMRERRKQFADAARRGYYVGGSHISFPGVGRLRADGRGYNWVPANFTQLR